MDSWCWQGTHVSVFAALVKWVYDEHLKWPFVDDIAIVLMNWDDGNEHRKMQYCIFRKKKQLLLQAAYPRITQVLGGGYLQWLSMQLNHQCWAQAVG